jgi:hypothetical protein
MRTGASRYCYERKNLMTVVHKDGLLFAGSCRQTGILAFKNGSIKRES